jgi:hypothetical protein
MIFFVSATAPGAPNLAPPLILSSLVFADHSLPDHRLVPSYSLVHPTGNGSECLLLPFPP